MQPGAAGEPVERAPRWLVVVVVAMVLAPLVAGAAGQLFAVGSSYHPAGDLAAIELHTRDVGRHDVELGQYSREQWSHPGPALFYALALPYRLSGSRSVGANVGALAINALSIAGMVVIGHRRGGCRLLWVSAVAGAILVRGLGPVFLIEPWNPSVPVLPFALFLFLVWEITCASVWAIPLAVLVGSFCVQTHVGYVPLVAPLLVVAIGWRLWGSRAAAVVPLIAAVGVLSVMWRGPLVEEARHDPGNLSRTIDYLTHSPEPRRTIGEGYAAAATQLSATPEWVTGRFELTPLTAESGFPGGAPIPVLVVPLAFAVACWWRRRAAVPLRLMAVAAASAGLGVVAVAQVRGPLYHYRLGWTRVNAMMAVTGAVWALWIAVAAWRPSAERRVLVPVCGAVLVALAAVGIPRFAGAGPPLADFSDDLGVIAPTLVDHLPAGDGPVILRCDGDEGCIYLSGLVLWFERAGIAVMVEVPDGVVSSGAPHRVFQGGPVRAVLHVRIDEELFARTLAGDPQLLARTGDRPTAARAALARQILLLDAERRADRLSPTDYLAARTELTNRLGTGVGVLLEALTP